MQYIKVKSVLAVAALAVVLAGCHDNGAQQASNDSRHRNGSGDSAESAAYRTPEGDRYDKPIPYPHFPYDISRGGGGGAAH